MKRFLWLGSVGIFFALLPGCGDVFRPIIIPNPPIFPNPKASHTIATISDNGTVANGSAMVVDVSGDSITAMRNVGLRPVHAVQQTATQLLVVNQAVPGVGSDSISKLSYSGTSISAIATITLPASFDPAPPHAATTSMPNYVASTQATQAYVTLPNYQPNSSGAGTNPIIPSLAVINTAANNVVTLIQVSANPAADPVALAETPDGSKLYVANHGDNSVAAFNTVDQSARTITGGTFTSPLWVSARSDSQRVYVLNGNGIISTINTATTGGPDTVIDASISVPGANYMWYDMILNRLYIPAGGQLTILDVSQSVPSTIATIPVPAFVLSDGSTVSSTAVAVTSLPDGSRAYVTSVPSSTDMALSSQTTITSVVGDGTNATYTYSLTSGYGLTPGVTLTIAGLFNGTTELTDFEGTFQVSSVISGTQACPTTCFQVANTNTLSATTVSGSASGSNIFPQVTVVNTTSNSAGTTIAIPGFAPYDAFCSPSLNPQAPRFRFSMAAGGDSSRAYLSSCDGGNVNLISTSTDTYLLNQLAPPSARPPQNSGQANPPQNPVFMLAGP
jgi:YVTN family beta-propeller protein